MPFRLIFQAFHTWSEGFNIWLSFRAEVSEMLEAFCGTKIVGVRDADATSNDDAEAIEVSERFAPHCELERCFKCIDVQEWLVKSTGSVQ